MIYGLHGLRDSGANEPTQHSSARAVLQSTFQQVLHIGATEHVVPECRPLAGDKRSDNQENLNRLEEVCYSPDVPALMMMAVVMMMMMKRRRRRMK